MDKISTLQLWVSKEKSGPIPYPSVASVKKVFAIECDEHTIDVCAIWSQEGKPMVFFSDKLNEDKRKYYSWSWTICNGSSLEKLRYYLLPK